MRPVIQRVPVCGLRFLHIHRVRNMRFGCNKSSFQCTHSHPITRGIYSYFVVGCIIIILCCFANLLPFILTTSRAAYLSVCLSVWAKSMQRRRWDLSLTTCNYYNSGCNNNWLGSGWVVFSMLISADCCWAIPVNQLWWMLYVVYGM